MSGVTAQSSLVIMPILSVLEVSRIPTPLNAISVIFSLTPGFIGISEQKHAMAIATVKPKPVTAFRILPMAVNQSRLITWAMNGNAGHEKSSKARIIHQLQLIEGITR